MRYTYTPARANQGACVVGEPPHSTDWVWSLSSPRRRSLAYEKRWLVETFDIGYADQTIPVFARWFGSWQISVQRLAYSSPELARRYDRAASGWESNPREARISGSLRDVTSQSVGRRSPRSSRSATTGARLRCRHGRTLERARSCATYTVQARRYRYIARHARAGTQEFSRYQSRGDASPRGRTRAPLR